MNKLINLNCNLEDSLSYSSSYLRKLRGTTNAYTDIPVTVDVLINKVITSPVDILNQDDKPTVFEKDLYLNDGYNLIEIVATDMNGNTKTISHEIYVEYLTHTPDKKDLLKNFIADDDLKISLELGSAKLEYRTKDVGLEKEILLDTSIDSNYFKLTGENANLYRISKKYIPRIQGDIIKRPLQILYDYVEKIYDGSKDITSAIKKLKLNDGYYLKNIHKEQYDYTGDSLVKTISERKVMSKYLVKTNEYVQTEYFLEELNIDFSNFYIDIDGIEGYSLVNEQSGNAEIIFNLPEIKEKTFEYINTIIKGTDEAITKLIKKNKENIVSNDEILEGLFYYKSDDETFIGVNSLNCFDINNHRINIPVVKEFKNLNDCKTWLSLIHNKILKVELIKNQIDNTNVLKFIYQDDDTSLYKVINGLNIKYNYSIKTDSEYIIYRNSDEGMLQVDFEKAFFKSKNVTDEIQPITINNINFVGGILGDASKNYQVANYSSIGKILKRTIKPHIQCLDKVYDGSPIVPIKINDNYYNGFENSIPGDDIYLDIAYEGDKDSETHIFTRTGNTIFVAENADVGDNKNVTINNICLEGHDATNYIIGEVISNYKTNITKRPIELTINKIRFIRSTRQWEMEYSITNDIKTDKLTLVYNTNDNLDIKVYGGIDTNGNSIHLQYDKYPDIISLFFNYPFNPHYQFVDLGTEVKLISTDADNKSDTRIAYWLNNARPAEPDTERIDILTNIDNDYSGGIKFSLDTVSSGIQTFYFESENKDYKLYSGCKVMVTNLNLNPLNNKSKNYTLINSTYETEIEII